MPSCFSMPPIRCSRPGVPGRPLGPNAAPLRPLLDREPVAAQDGSGQRGIAVLTLPRTHVMFDWVAGCSYPEGANLAAVNRERRRAKGLLRTRAVPRQRVREI